jgi:hypothetical protein
MCRLHRHIYMCSLYLSIYLSEVWRSRRGCKTLKMKTGLMVGGFMVIWWLLAVSRITILVKRDVENASASLTGFNKSFHFVLMYTSIQSGLTVLVSTVSDISLVDSPSISLGDQTRVTKGVLNEREVLLDFVSLVYLKWFKQVQISLDLCWEK